MYGPSPLTIKPMAAAPSVRFLKNITTNPNIIAGDYTIVHLPDGVDDFERFVLYHYPFMGDKLIFGKFCGIAREVKFIMNGSHHKMTGISTYPFHILANGWEKVTPPISELPMKGDTVIENDVWIGFNSVIRPGIRIGNGACVASCSMVTKDVPPYSIVGGNPAKLIRMRFSDEEIDILQNIAWWDWPADKLTEHLELIVNGDVMALAKVA